ncbi:MAG: lysophospholipid acyltransferase family protein [Mariprofundaceae bacterium]|nr:lysophospholipid acyltransferase family protein [Mariprofundaceae bacterium]
MNILQAALVRGIFWFIRLIPVRLAGAIGAGLGRLGFYLIKRRRCIAECNLARIYPERDRRWRHRIARESFAEMGRTILETPHVFLRSKAFLQSRTQVEGEDELLAAKAQGKGAFLTFYHHSNWEMCGMAYSTFVSDLHCIYRPLKQPSLEHFVKQCRERFGVSMHPRQEGLHWLLKALKQGHSICVLLDQHLSGGMPVPFLGHLATTTTLPAIFVSKHDTPVFAVALHRIGKAFRFRLQFWRIDMPAMTGDKNADIYRIMHCIGKSFEPVINQRPEMWLWSHQRWKLLEEHYKEITEVVYGTP